MVQDPHTRIGHRRIVPVGEVINVDISFPLHAWLIPGAMIFLPLNIDNGKQKARAGALGMINDIVGRRDRPGDVSGNLNSLQGPDGMEMHDVRRYVDFRGNEIFEETYCPDLDFDSVVVG